MNILKDYVGYFIKIIIRNIARVFFLFPINNNRILFSSYLGEKVTGNPKSICDFLLDQYKNQYEYVWVYNGDKGEISLPENVKLIRRFSLKWFFFSATSKIIIDNCTPPFLLPRRKKQLYIETWHAGGAYKKVGIAIAKNKINKKIYNKQISSISIFLSSSKGFTEGNIELGCHYNGEVLKCGMPRNDIFFNPASIKNATDKVRDYYLLKGPFILYAPTYRGHIKQSAEINIILDIARLQKALKKRYGRDFYILVRCHHWDKHNYKFGGNVIDARNYSDMQELLCAADMLITDYSSSIWDFSLLGRPCLLYTPDIDQYIENRGFFTSPEQWPGIICRSMDDLCNEIQNLDKETCSVMAKRHLESMESYETGHATEIISTRILNFMHGE